MDIVSKEQIEARESRTEAEKIVRVNKKDVSKIREEIKILEDEKTNNPGFSIEHAASIAPYISQEVPTLFKIIYMESEKDYIQISDVMLGNLEKLNSGEINADKATEQLGRYLFDKLVKPNLPE